MAAPWKPGRQMAGATPEAAENTPVICFSNKCPGVPLGLKERVLLLEHGFIGRPGAQRGLGDRGPWCTAGSGNTAGSGSTRVLGAQGSLGACRTHSSRPHPLAQVQSWGVSTGSSDLGMCQCRVQAEDLSFCPETPEGCHELTPGPLTGRRDGGVGDRACGDPFALLQSKGLWGPLHISVQGAGTLKPPHNFLKCAILKILSSALLSCAPMSPGSS